MRKPDRVCLLDELRGLAVLLMIFYHGAYDAVYIFRFTGSGWFTSAPMEEPFEITGHAMAHIQFEMLTDDTDIDFFVTMSDYDPETGESFLFDDGHLRASLRGTAEPPYGFLGLPWHPANQADAQPITTGEVYELEIDMMPTSYIIPEGHCLRVTLSNSMDRFYYLGRSEYEADSSCETPDVRIYTGGEHASYIELPDIYAGQ